MQGFRLDMREPIGRPFARSNAIRLGSDFAERPAAPAFQWPTWETTGPTGILTPMSGEYRMWRGDGWTPDTRILQNADLDGTIIVQDSHCVAINSRIRGGAPDVPVVRFDWGSGASELGFTMINCELDGKFGNGTVNGFAGDTDINLGMIGCRITNVHNGLNTGSGLYERNFIRIVDQGAPDAHYDGVEVNGIPTGYRLVLRRNRVIVEPGQTGAINLSNVFTGLHDCLAEENWLSGGGYTVYVDDRFGGGPVDGSSIIFRNNKIGSGIYGPWALYGAGAGIVREGNYDEVTGAPV